MAQTSKFSGALSRLRTESEPEAAPERPADVPSTPVPALTLAKRRGRPLGKRSDPDFKPTTLFLRTRTKRTAMRLLEDQGDQQDLSELVEQLLLQWNNRHS
jgi:hypothetical protein